MSKTVIQIKNEKLEKEVKLEKVEKTIRAILKKWKPRFGNDQDLIVMSNLNKLKKKKLTIDQRIQYTSNVIFNLKEILKADKIANNNYE